MSSLVVRIEDLDKPVSVSRIENGLEVGKREVLVDDYIRSLMESLDEQELLGYLMEKEFIEIIEKYLAYQVMDNESYSKLFEIVLDNCKSITNVEPKDNDAFAKLFNLLLERVNLKEVSEELLPNLLKNILKNVESANSFDMLNYNKLFRILLERIEINKSASSLVVHQFLEELLKRLEHPKNKDDLKGIFDLIVDKAAEDEWVEEVISKRKPKTTATSTPILPAGTVFYKESMGGIKTFILEIPKHQRDIQYQELHYKQVGHPNLLFVYQLVGKEIRNMMIFAKDSKPLTEDSTLFHYPYSHVYENGTVCWGYRSEVIEAASQLDVLSKVFLGTKNNHDLTRRGSIEKYVSLKGKEFPDSLLEPTNLTFKKLVDLI